MGVRGCVWVWGVGWVWVGVWVWVWVCVGVWVWVCVCGKAVFLKLSVLGATASGTPGW